MEPYEDLLIEDHEWKGYKKSKNPKAVANKFKQRACKRKEKSFQTTEEINIEIEENLEKKTSKNDNDNSTCKYINERSKNDNDTNNGLCNLYPDNKNSQCWSNYGSNLDDLLRPQENDVFGCFVLRNTHTLEERWPGPILSPISPREVIYVLKKLMEDETSKNLPGLTQIDSCMRDALDVTVWGDPVSLFEDMRSNVNSLIGILLRSYKIKDKDACIVLVLSIKDETKQIERRKRMVPKKPPQAKRKPKKKTVFENLSEKQVDEMTKESMQNRTKFSFYNPRYAFVEIEKRKPQEQDNYNSMF